MEISPEKRRHSRLPERQKIPNEKVKYTDFIGIPNETPPTGW
jgi:hypothetical protein